MKLRVIVRLLEIQRVLLRHGLDDFVRATHLYRPLRFFFYLSPGVWFERRRKASRGERIRLALEELGPVFVKFGQAVSTRRDLLPGDIADELARLQDRVPPFPGAAARRIVEQALGSRCTISSRPLMKRRSRLPRSLKCTSRGCPMAKKSWSRCCGPTCTKSLRDLAVLPRAGELSAALLARAADRPHRSRRRIRENHSR